jgi:hypothetical protein
MYYLIKLIFYLIALPIVILANIIGFIKLVFFPEKEKTNGDPEGIDKQAELNRIVRLALEEKTQIGLLNLKNIDVIKKAEGLDLFTGYAEVKEENGLNGINVYFNEGDVFRELFNYYPEVFLSIKTKFQGKIFIWGKIINDDDAETRFANIYLPVGFSKEEISEIQHLITIVEKNQELLNNKNLTNHTCFKVLENYLTISKMHERLGRPWPLLFEPEKRFLPNFAKKLLQEKNWHELVKLEKFSPLIGRLNERYANAIYKKIETAKVKISENPTPKKHQDSRIIHWETPRAFWCNAEQPGYRYSEKKKAWWKQKE